MSTRDSSVVLLCLLAGCAAHGEKAGGREEFLARMRQYYDGEDLSSDAMRARTEALPKIWDYYTDIDLDHLTEAETEYLRRWHAEHGSGPIRLRSTLPSAAGPQELEVVAILEALAGGEKLDDRALLTFAQFQAARMAAMANDRGSGDRG